MTLKESGHSLTPVGRSLYGLSLSPLPGFAAHPGAPGIIVATVVRCHRCNRSSLPPPPRSCSYSECLLLHLPQDTSVAFPTPDRMLLLTAQEANMVLMRPLLLLSTDRLRISKKRSFLSSVFSNL
ncbi:hypothetical protein L596_000182 [Steinernema carpocapsae]|uniref:Uncharacterized protein n=1 Tax=Steinernema carpocapsae TaxID=34508 RepID=A0A4U8ULK7_STECR|nr:hypothetical protein L596_000182 [Steinernema carpocapsae]